MTSPLDDLNNALDAHQIVYWLAKCRGAPTAEALDAMKETHANHRKEPAPMPPKIETYPFRCTAREARKIQENLRYTSAARELADAANRVCNEWSVDDLTADAVAELSDKFELFRTIADE